MQEYKVLNSMLGFIKKSQTFEEILNTYAREDWVAKSIDTNNHVGNTYSIIAPEKIR